MRKSPKVCKINNIVTHNPWIKEESLQKLESSWIDEKQKYEISKPVEYKILALIACSRMQ